MMAQIVARRPRSLFARPQMAQPRLGRTHLHLQIAHLLGGEAQAAHPLHQHPGEHAHEQQPRVLALPQAVHRLVRVVVKKVRHERGAQHRAAAQHEARLVSAIAQPDGGAYGEQRPATDAHGGLVQAVRLDAARQRRDGQRPGQRDDRQRPQRASRPANEGAGIARPRRTRGSGGYRHG